MTTPNIDLDTRTETVETTYVKFNGEEFDVMTVLEFLDGIQGTDGFVSTFRWESKYEDLADALIAEDVVKKTAKGSWYEHENRCERLFDELRAEYINEENNQ